MVSGKGEKKPLLNAFLVPFSVSENFLICILDNAALLFAIKSYQRWHDIGNAVTMVLSMQRCSLKVEWIDVFDFYETIV